MMRLPSFLAYRAGGADNHPHFRCSPTPSVEPSFSNIVEVCMRQSSLALRVSARLWLAAAAVAAVSFVHAQQPPPPPVPLTTQPPQVQSATDAGLTPEQAAALARD